MKIAFGLIVCEAGLMKEKRNVIWNFVFSGFCFLALFVVLCCGVAFCFYVFGLCFPGCFQVSQFALSIAVGAATCHLDPKWSVAPAMAQTHYLREVAAAFSFVAAVACAAAAYMQMVSWSMPLFFHNSCRHHFLIHQKKRKTITR